MASTYSLLRLCYNTKRQVYSMLVKMLTLSMRQFWHAYQQIAPLLKGFVPNLTDLCLILPLVNYSPLSDFINDSVPTARDPSRWARRLDYTFHSDYRLCLGRSDRYRRGMHVVWQTPAQSLGVRLTMSLSQIRNALRTSQPGVC